MFCIRYRSMNSATNNGNYQYLTPVLPAIAVARPAYQRFSVPPPVLPGMENNYMPRKCLLSLDSHNRTSTYTGWWQFRALSPRLLRWYMRLGNRVRIGSKKPLTRPKSDIIVCQPKSALCRRGLCLRDIVPDETTPLLEYFASRYPLVS